MVYDDEDNLFEEEFDFVDEDDDEGDDGDLTDQLDDDATQVEEKEEVKPKRRASNGKKRSVKPKPRKRSKASKGETVDEASGETSDKDSAETADEEPEEKGPPPPPTDHRVHLYEFGSFTRTIQREFTLEDAEAFAKEFNRTSKSYSRQAVAAGKDDEPALGI
ncbi:MAG: hypothetical protein MKZ95_07275 [Pirellulales bacterium]|nr:hypothetical protein [Pirellulales bacterium]